MAHRIQLLLLLLLLLLAAASVFVLAFAATSAAAAAAAFQIGKCAVHNCRCCRKGAAASGPRLCAGLLLHHQQVRRQQGLIRQR